MEVNQFSISSAWNAREESPEQLGRRMLRNLDAIIAINPYFKDWWFLDLEYSPWDMNEGNSSEFLVPLAEARVRMTEIVEGGVSKDDDDQPEPMGGYSISASNSIDGSPHHVTLDARGGGVAGLHSATFETDSGEAPDPEIVTFPIFMRILLAMISSWNVDRAEIYSSELRKHWRQIPWRRSFDLSWMTYLSAPLARRITPPPGVLSERTADGGLLLIATDETFDVANPAHMTAARSIVEALAPFNGAADDEDRRTIRQWPIGSLVGRLADLTMQVPSTGKSCLDDVPSDYKAQMRQVLEDLLSNNGDEASLVSAWRKIGGGPVFQNLNLRDKLETLLGWF